MLKMISGLVAVVRMWVLGKKGVLAKAGQPRRVPTRRRGTPNWAAELSKLTAATRAAGKSCQAFSEALATAGSKSPPEKPKTGRSACQECGSQWVHWPASGGHKLDCSAGRACDGRRAEFDVGDRVRRKSCPGAGVGTVTQCWPRHLIIKWDGGLGDEMWGRGGLVHKTIDPHRCDGKSPMSPERSSFVVGDRVRRRDGSPGSGTVTEYPKRGYYGTEHLVVKWDGGGSSRCHDLHSEASLVCIGDRDDLANDPGQSDDWVATGAYKPSVHDNVCMCCECCARRARGRKLAAQVAEEFPSKWED